MFRMSHSSYVVQIAPKLEISVKLGSTMLAVNTVTLTIAQEDAAVKTGNGTRIDAHLQELTVRFLCSGTKMNV